MKEKIRIVLETAVLIFIMLAVSSCGLHKSAPDSMEYLPETDMQYFQVSETNKTALIQETDRGCYVYHDQFIYFLDRESQNLTPLCSKPNCLHDRETDSKKRTLCNAHIDGIRETPEIEAGCFSLMLYENDLYFSYDAKFSVNGEILEKPSLIMKIACDGTSKEVIYQHDGIRFAMQHRGYIYFYASEYYPSEEMISFRYPLWRIDIRKKQPKKELVYDPGVSSLMSGSFLIGIGNYVFFDMDTSGERNDTGQKIDLSDSAMRVEISDFSFSTGVYDIHKGTIERISLPILHPTWFNGYLYQTESLTIPEDMDPWSLEALKRETKIKQIATDGTDGDAPIKAICSSLLHSDFSYFYVTSGTLTTFFKEEESWVKIYDKNFQLIDECVFPETSYYYNDPPIGGEYQYLLFEEDTGEWGLYIWDKNEIGSLHGSACIQEKVSYGKTEQDDPQNTDEGSVKRTDEARHYVEKDGFSWQDFTSSGQTKKAKQ